MNWQVWYGTHGPCGLKAIWIFRGKPIDFYWKCLLLLWPWQRSNLYGWCMLTGSSIDVSTVMIRTFETQRWQYVPTSKVWNIKTFFYLVTLKTKSRSGLWHAIKGLVIMQLRYTYQVCTSNGYLFMNIYLSHWSNWSGWCILSRPSLDVHWNPLLRRSPARRYRIHNGHVVDPEFYFWLFHGKIIFKMLIFFWNYLYLT